MSNLDRFLARGKELDGGEWVIGDAIIIPNHNGKYIREQSHWEHTCNGGGVDFGIDKIQPETLCQCTGLKDKDGKLIFEHDIVEWLDNLYLVVYEAERGCWNLDHVEGGTFSDFIFTPSADVEIIGNKFDNPELLEGVGDE